MKTFVILFLLSSNFMFGQQWTENTATQLDTSEWKYIRDYIKDQTAFINISPDGELYYKRGQLKAKINDYQGAINDLNKSLEFNSKEPVVFYARGAVKERLEDYEGAKDDFTKVIELQPEFAGGWNDRGQVKSRLKKFDEAELDFNRAIELRPNWTVPVFNLGLLYERKSEYNKAIGFYSESVKIDSSNYLAYYNLGNMYFQLENWNLSITHYTLAINIFPEYIKAIKNRASAKNEKGDLEGACKDFLLASELGDREALEYFNDFCIEKK